MVQQGYSPQVQQGSMVQQVQQDHLNIALQMVVSLYFGGKSHVLNGQHVSFKEPCAMRHPPPPIKLRGKGTPPKDGCGSKICTQNEILVNGNMDQNGPRVV